jgi:hypothetical protein
VGGKTSTQVSTSGSPRNAPVKELSQREKTGLRLLHELEEHVMKIESYTKTLTDSSGAEVFCPPAARDNQDTGVGAQLIRHRVMGVKPQ